jgi:hypothetical protein
MVCTTILSPLRALIRPSTFVVSAAAVARNETATINAIATDAILAKLKWGITFSPLGIRLQYVGLNRAMSSTQRSGTSSKVSKALVEDD